MFLDLPGHGKSDKPKDGDYTMDYFADAVDAIGCVYIDVDRRYFIPPEQGISEIDIEAGYQRLCGFKALQYVRFRHEDNDLVRAMQKGLSSRYFVRGPMHELESIIHHRVNRYLDAVHGDGEVS